MNNYISLFCIFILYKYKIKHMEITNKPIRILIEVLIELVKKSRGN